MEAQTININEVFEIKSPNEWMREARSKPVPKQLFGELWLEGEIAIMFADTGKGKSVLSMQIAESIAKGRPIYPFEMTARPQRVLYLDFELTGKQFEMRYTKDHDPQRHTSLRKPYLFSERCRRIELRPDVLQQKDGRSIEESIRDLLEELVEQSKATVLIIDNITYLKRTADGMREAVPLMKELHRLKRRLGLSILVIAHTPKRDIRRPLAVNDLQGSKAIANYADNIFSIGQSRQEPSGRYIKHIKPRSAELVYDASHLPVFKLHKIGGNFLGFEFKEFSNEAAMLREPVEGKDFAHIVKVKEMHDAGMSIRKIAEELGFSRSSTHRYLQRWRPEMSEEGVDVDAVGLPEQRHDYFPGCEEYDEANHDPRLDVDYGREDIETRFLRREHYLIQLARHDARTAYTKTGVAPRLDEHEKYRDFKEAVRVYIETGVVQDAIAYMFPQEEATEITEDTEQSGFGTTGVHERTQNESPLSTVHCPVSARIDGYGREILVEEFETNGKPRIWYQTDTKGNNIRYERKGFGIFSQLVE